MFGGEAILEYSIEQRRQSLRTGVGQMVTPTSRAQSSVRLRIAKTTGNSFCREGRSLDAADLVAIGAFIDEDAPHCAAVVLSGLLAATERLAVFPSEVGLSRSSRVASLVK